jgi:hypothetical protein
MVGPRPRQVPIMRKPASAEAENAENAPTKKKKRSKSKRHRLALKPGQAPSNGRKPCKLCDELEERICQYLREGASIVDAATLAGVNNVTVTEWRAHGSQEPGSRYGLFYERTEVARAAWKHGGIARMTQSPDMKNFWRLLCSRYPREFRNYFSAELSGPEGTSIPIQQNPFSVSITMNTEPGQPSQEFMVRPYEKEGANGNGART